jgi:hypothetical protein
MKLRYDTKHKPTFKFEIGDKVYVEAMNIKQDRPSKKLSDKRIGPYKILEKIGEAAWKLDMPSTDKKYLVFNEELLTKYNKPPPHRTDPRPPLNIIDDELEYKVEEIVKHQCMS